MTISLRPVREVTHEEEGFRLEPLASGPDFRAMTTRRNPVEPEPVGTYVVMVFKITGYDPDYDGSLMARFAAVDRHGEPTGWEPTHLGLYPDTDLVVQHPGDLWVLAEQQDSSSDREEPESIYSCSECQASHRAHRKDI